VNQDFLFHQGQDSPFAVASDAGIPFPVSVPGPFLHAGWPLFDADAVGDQGAYGPFGAPAPSLPGLSRIGAHDGSPFRILVDESINGFRAYPHAGMTGIIDPQPVGNLLWKPADHEFVSHVLSQGLIIQASGTPAGLTPFFVHA
jgi:hypothetical protein